MSGRLSGKRCVVTGAASGIGDATARLFASEGAEVIAVDAAPVAPGEGLFAVEADVADEAAAAKTVRAAGPVDVLVTAAGISMGGLLHEVSLQTWRKVLEVNLLGTVVWAGAVLPGMRAAGRGSIVTVASQLALAGGRGNPAYVASKGAVISLTRALALDYAPDGIRVNAIVPGAIETPMLSRSFARTADPETARARSRDRHAMGRFGRADEVAHAALWLASDDASFTTGAVTPVDGGWLAA